MEPCVESFLPSRWYSRAGWLTLAGSAAVASFGFRSPVFLILGSAGAVVSLLLLWLSARPAIQVGETQFNIGERAIAWREVKEVNRVRLLSPLILRIKLTNSRRRTLIYPGDVSRVEQLVHLLRKNSHLATFDGIAYRDYWTWSSLAGLHGASSHASNAPVSGPKQLGPAQPLPKLLPNPSSRNYPKGVPQRSAIRPAVNRSMDQPVRMLSQEEEDEIERMYQKLKAVGSLDFRIDPHNSDED
jgi:hypothetical protein